MRSLVLSLFLVAVVPACTVGSDGAGSIAAPSGLTATVVNGGAHLTWTDNAVDETQYMVMRMANGGAYEEAATLPADAALYHDASVTTGIEYMYMVMATNATDQAESNEIVFSLP